MGFVEKSDVYRPSQGEAPFAVDEIFFSCTDKRGVIQAANYIFKRVAGYEWDDLLGAPHKLIRHPDMPKGVFWLFWELLNNGQPVGAYVKNKTKDGLYYWVFAVAMPFHDGFLSVRVKPTGKLQGVIEKEYEILRKAEVEGGITPEESATILLQRIQALGYDDYQAFSSDALFHELTARDLAMGNEQSATTGLFGQMLAAADKLEDETAALTTGFQTISTVPTNMRIIAARLEPSGGAISSLAQNYWEMSEEMSRWFQNYVGGPNRDFLTIRNTLVTSQFLCGVARILKEIASKFNGEYRSLGEIVVLNEKSQINEMAATFIEKANIGLQQVAKEAEKILRAITMIRRLTLGLSSTKVMCNIESARLPSGGGSLIDVINQLGAFQENMEGQLNQIEEQGYLIMECAQTLIAPEGGSLTGPR